jgi:hypothetical protein
MGRRLEIGVALALTLWLLLVAPLGLFMGIAGAGLRALFTAPRLDATGDAALATLRSLFIIAPIVFAFARARRHRLLWAPLVVPPLLMALAVAPHGITGAGKFVVLAALSVGALVAQARPALRLTAALPLLFAYHPTLTTHQRFSLRFPGQRDRMLARCASNDGERSLSSAFFTPDYYGLTPVGTDRWLLTGESFSWWVDRAAGGNLRYWQRSAVHGNYWSGSEGAGASWIAHRDDARKLHWMEDRSISLLGTRHPAEVDLLDAVYDDATRSVFVGELAHGGLIALPVDGGAPARYPLDLFYLQLAALAPGELAGISTTELVVIDTRTKEVRQRLPAALCAGGLATCGGAVVVSDYAGRVRLFERRGGQLQLVRSTAARAPRHVAFSPDCSAVAVVSADDQTLSIVARDDLSTKSSYRLGPGLRSVLWLDNHQLLAVDACGISTVRP